MWKEGSGGNEIFYFPLTTQKWKEEKFCAGNKKSKSKSENDFFAIQNKISDWQERYTKNYNSPVESTIKNY